VPTGATSLQSISFWFGRRRQTQSGAAPDLRYRLHVIEWNPLLHRTTGDLLFSSGVFDASALQLYTPTKVTSVMQLPVYSGMRLMAFASPFDVPQPTAPDPIWNYAMMGYGDSPSQYSGGEAWSIAIGPDFGTSQTMESALNQPWGRGLDFDMLFEADFTSVQTVVPEPSTGHLVGLGLAALIGAQVRSRRRSRNGVA
jgi:hypothetical protein